VIVASENRLGRRLSQDKIERMKIEIMEVVNRYVRGVDEQDVQMSVRSEADIEMLEMNINLPEER
jgi:cell division topological specificity factor